LTLPITASDVIFANGAPLDKESFPSKPRVLDMRDAPTDSFAGFEQPTVQDPPTCVPKRSCFCLVSMDFAVARWLDSSTTTWRAETFNVTHSKRGGRQQYPLHRDVGEAVLQYLKQGLELSAPVRHTEPALSSYPWERLVLDRKFLPRTSLRTSRIAPSISGLYLC
jgi:hypothetical protein